MKVLILTCNTGQGHNSSAAAIREVCRNRKTECDIADTLGFLSKSASRIIDTCFTGIYRHIPRVFDAGYSKTDSHIGNFSAGDYLTKVLPPGAVRLKRYLEKNGYTHAVCVHIFAAVMVSILTEKYVLPLKTSFLSTDYTRYPFLEKTDTDLYFLPHRDLAGEFTEGGVDEDRMIATGIPVRREFLNSPSREEARASLKITEKEKVVFLMGGSMGCGPMEELALSLADLPEKIRLLVSCGTNEKLLRALQKQASPEIVPFRYADDIPRIMAASDLFITKPGGISITEAGVMGLPTLLMDVVGGCETPNYEFFINHGYAFGAKDVPDAVRQCTELLNSPEKRSEQSERLKGDFRKDAAQELFDALTAR